MTTPDKPKPVASASVERPETDLDGLLDVFALDLEVRLKHVVDETKQGIDAAKLAETQANTGIGGETTPKQRLKRDVPRKKIERGGGETSSESGLIEAQALLREWSDIRLTAPDKGAFDAAVKTRLRIERLPNITTHQATVANLERRVRGEAVPGDDSVLSKTYDLQVWLPKYRAIVEAVRAVVAEMDVQSKPEAAPKKPERTDNQANLLTEQLARWDSLVAEIEKIGGKERLEQMIVKKLEEKRIGTMKWESLHQQVRKTLGEIQAGTSSKSTEKQQAFLAGNTTFYQEFLALAEQLRDEVKVRRGLVKRDDHATKTKVPVKGSHDTPVLSTRVSGTISEGKTPETYASIEESLGKLRRQDREIWYRNQVGDILVVRPTRNVEVFQLWRPDGSMRLEHYRTLATALYSEGVSFEGNRLQRGDAPYGEKLQGDAVNVSKQNPGALNQKLSPEGERQVGELVALLEQQRDRWRGRIEALNTKEEFDALTSEAGKNGSWTTVPGFVVGNALVRLLKEQSITDPAVVQVIKDQAFVLQRELNPLYLAKRDKFYPPRTSDAKAPKQEAPQQLSREQLRSWGELKPEERGERAKSLEQWCISFWQNLQGKLEEKGMKNRKQQAALIRPAYEKKLTENIREKLSVHMTDEEMQSISRALEKVIARLQ